MLKLLKWLIAAVILIIIVYFVGPKARNPVLTTDLPEIKGDLTLLESEINQSEKTYRNLKPDNQARIVWFDSLNKTKTPISLVYIHGFSASQGEGIPVHINFARRYCCNLYLARLYEHGLESEDAFLDMTPEGLLQTAKEAVAIGKKLGDKVILMSTSTGGTLSLYIASGNPDIQALICYSPNIDLYDNKSFILTSPWGLQLSRLVLGSNYYDFSGPPGTLNYWITHYRIEGLIALKSLVNASMTKEVFSRVKMPLFMGYYYKDEQHQDNVVSVPAMLKMFDELGTQKEQKRKVCFPEAGTHPIASQIWSHDIKNVEEETFRFAEEILHLKPLR